MIALTYVESYIWALLGVGVAILAVAFLGSIGAPGRILVGILAVFAAFVAGVAAIIWWIS